MNLANSSLRALDEYFDVRGEVTRSGPTPLRQAVSLSLSVDLVAAIKELTDDLSGTVDALLARWVQDARRRADNAALDRIITALNGSHAEHGFLSDEFSHL